MIPVYRCVECGSLAHQARNCDFVAESCRKLAAENAKMRSDHQSQIERLKNKIDRYEDAMSNDPFIAGTIEERNR